MFDVGFLVAQPSIAFKKEWISKKILKERRECTVHRTGNERRKNTRFEADLSEEEEEAMTGHANRKTSLLYIIPVAGSIYCSLLAIHISGGDLLSSQLPAVR